MLIAVNSARLLKFVWFIASICCIGNLVLCHWKTVHSVYAVPAKENAVSQIVSAYEVPSPPNDSSASPIIQSQLGELEYEAKTTSPYLQFKVYNLINILEI